jgi:SAM-dependent methyltransferase
MIKEPEIPPRFDYRFYTRDKNYLKSKSEAEIHFESVGIANGYAGSMACNQGNFIRLIREMKPESILEIGPGKAPKLEGSNVYYFDVKSRSDLQKRYGQDSESGRIPEEIHFVNRCGDLGIINMKFDVVFSSHMIEHSLDLIGHLNQVKSILNPGGYYFLVAPNKNYTFDYFKPDSVAEDAIAHHIVSQGSPKLSTRSLLLEQCRRTHNDATRHWLGDHGKRELNVQSITWVKENINRINEDHIARSGYHSWVFSDITFMELIRDLNLLNQTSLDLVACYNTIYGSCSFNAILKSQ